MNDRLIKHYRYLCCIDKSRQRKTQKSTVMVFGLYNQPAIRIMGMYSIMVISKQVHKLFSCAAKKQQYG